MSDNRTLYQRASDVFPPVAGRYTTLGIVRAEGTVVWDETGRRYLDFASGVAVVNVGHNHPKVVQAAMDQMAKLVHGGHNVVYYPTYVSLAEKLVELFGGDAKVYFCNSGAEANEGAVKLAKKVTGRPGILSFKRGFHGRTLAMTSLTASNAAYRRDYEGLLPSVYFADYPFAKDSGLSDQDEVERCLRSVNEVFELLISPDQVAAMVVEPIQGEGGYIVPPAPFLQALRALCDKHGILLIFDEIQTGFGRTGKMFAWEHFLVQPDVMTLAKGMANGLPLGAIVGRKSLMERWPMGSHGGTFGGNPVSTAASLAVIDLLENGLLTSATEKGEWLRAKLIECQSSHPCMWDIRGMGLMVGVEFRTQCGAPDEALVQVIREKAIDKGLILLHCGLHKNVIRFIPPISVTCSEIDEAVRIFAESVAEATQA